MLKPIGVSDILPKWNCELICESIKYNIAFYTLNAHSYTFQISVNGCTLYNDEKKNAWSITSLFTVF